MPVAGSRRTREARLLGSGGVLARYFGDAGMLLSGILLDSVCLQVVTAVNATLPAGAEVTVFN